MQDYTQTDPNRIINSVTGQTAGSMMRIPTTQTPVTVDLSKYNTGSLNVVPKSDVTVPNITNLTTPQVDKAQTTQTTTPTIAPDKQNIAGRLSTMFDIERLTSLFSSSKNKEADINTAVSTATEPYYKQLNELETQIKTHQANAIQNQESAITRVGGTTSSNSAEAQRIARTDAIEAIKLSALAEGMRGNIALAQDRATKAVEAKYAERTRQIEDAKTNIYNNYDSFTPAQKKKADATLLRLDANDVIAKMNIENEKAVQGIIQLAIKQGSENGVPVPTTILNQASNLSDPTQATALLAPYLKDAAKIQSALLDNQYKQAQINRIAIENSKTLAEKAKILAETTPSPTSKVQLQNNEALTIAKELVKKDAIGKSSAVGSSIAKLIPFAQDIGLQGNRTAFEAKVDTLKSNLTLENLKLLKGAMSDKDLLFLNSIGSSLNLNMSESQFDSELNRIIKKLEEAGATSGSSGSGSNTVVMTGPKGTFNVPIDKVELYKQNGYK